MSFTSLISAVDPATISTALLGLGAVMIVPRLARMGIAWVKGGVK